MYTKRSTALFLLLLLVSAPWFPLANAQDQPPLRYYLPLVQEGTPANNPFGFDLRYYQSDAALPYISKAQARWARAGDVSWAAIESTKGTYNWDAMASLDANIKRLRRFGIQPTLVIQQSPAWAQRISGRLCSPPKQEAIADFARFAGAIAARYAGQVDHWEIWNEPEFAANQVPDSFGVGCWGGLSGSNYNGGDYYGEMLKQVYPAIKKANPNATVMAGAMAYFWPDDSKSSLFLRGILASGAGTSFDMLSFHAYGDWGPSSLLVAKTVRIRQILADNGLPDKPLIATEIAATCASNDKSTCSPDYATWVDYKQANFAARIYAEAVALDLDGAFWYTLASESPGFAYSHLIDLSSSGALTPRPAYHAFINSARLLQDATYVGDPLKPLANDQMQKVQALEFKKPNSRLFVLWVPQLGSKLPLYTIPIKSDEKAICTHKLDQERPVVYYCNIDEANSEVPITVNELPRYVEICRSDQCSRVLQSIRASFQ